MPKTVMVRGRDLVVDFNTGLDITLDDPLFELLYDNVKTAIEGQKVTASTIITITTLVMQSVGKVPELSGPQKKKLVIELITKLVGEIEMEDQDRQAVQLLLQTTLPGIIDALCDAAKGKYNFKLKEAKAQFKKLFSCCFQDAHTEE